MPGGAVERISDGSEVGLPVELGGDGFQPDPQSEVVASVETVPVQG
jgi:hypothetical protein